MKRYPGEPRADGEEGASRYHPKRSLADFMAFDEPVVMRNAADVRYFSIPVPWRAWWPVLRTDIAFQNSSALHPSRSQLALLWNQAMISQASLDGDRPDGRLIAEMPTKYLEDDFHTLELRALQHGDGECGDPFSPDLWTQIDTENSTIELDYQLRKLSPALSDINRLIDHCWWGDYRLSLVTTDPAALNDRHLDWLARATERVALLLDFVPLSIEHRTDLRRHTGDHLVIGTRQEIAPALPESIVSRIGESFIGIYPHPENDRYFVLVISGINDAGVEKALRAFTATDFSLPPGAELDLADLDLPAPTPIGESRAAKPGRTYTFSELGFTTRESSGLNREKFGVELILPPGVSAAEGDEVRVSLRIAWAAVRDDSRLKVYLNGGEERTIPLALNGATAYTGYEFGIPLRSFRPGKNWLSFQAELVPVFVDDCKSLDWEALRFVMHDDSSLHIPIAAQYLELPDLKITAGTAVPASYLENAGGGGEFHIQIAARDRNTIGAACTMLGKFVQIDRRRLPGTRLSFELPPPYAHYLAVGGASSIPGALLPSSLLKGESEAASDFRQLTGIASGGEDPAGPGLLMQFESPRRHGRVGMILTAADSGRLVERAWQLAGHAVWNRLEGDSFLFGTGNDARGIGPHRRFGSFHLGDESYFGRLRHHFSAKPLFYFGAVGAVLLVAGAAVARALLSRGVKRKRGPFDDPLWSV
ncbi:MAG: cellulose biosynthesis cyclic di-GMP-binding regulatory protein BcsB [Akkermansiaceae bacterium]|nr:cellulose biosynthesis cyclic di-GMP-binding regulatory protein BcsB [Akkermansiaceae bacterium]MCP5549396.1 cellulose biosynthesis cyclic di-GMP-binding regulatory protein BcsB [Akkermansiaceae bacterium]